VNESYPPPTLRRAFFVASLIASAASLTLGALGDDLAAWTVFTLAFLFSMELDVP
jgi:hypothetical protein